MLSFLTQIGMPFLFEQVWSGFESFGCVGDMAYADTGAGERDSLRL